MAVVERLYVELIGDSTALLGDFQAASRAAQRMGQQMQDVGKTLSAAITLPLAGVGVAAIKMASDAEEAANKFDVVMGDAADATRARLEELTETIPLTRSEMEKMAAGIQDMLVPMGLARDEAAGMSAEMVALAGDLGSFNNVGTDRVLEAMQSALAGSSEPMRRFGVDTREARLQALALSQGLIDQGEKLDNTSRALAVMAAIQADSTDAMGDAARTVDSTANSFRFLARDVKDITIAIGQVLIPIIQPLVDKLRDAVEALKGMSDAQRRTIVVMGLVAAAAGPVIVALGLLTSALGTLGVAIVGLNAALGPAGWLVLGLGAVALAVKAFADRAQDATTPLENYQKALRGLTREALLHEQAVTTIQFFDAKEAGASVEVLDLLIRKSVAIADEFGRLNAPVEQLKATMDGVADATERVAAAASSITVPDVGRADAPGNAGVVGGPLGNIPLAMEALFGLDAAAEELGNELDETRGAAGLLSRATSGVSQDFSNLAGAFAAGGVVGVMIAGITSIFSSAERQARRIEAARQNFERVLDAYVNELADLSRWEQVERAAVEGAKAALQALTDQFIVGIKSDKIREQAQAAFGNAIEGLDIEALEGLLAQFGPEGQAILEEFKRRMEEVNRLREEEATEAERAAEAAAEAARQLKQAAFDAAKIKVGDVFADFTARDLALKGDDRGAFAAELTANARQEIAALQELVDAGALSESALTRLAAIINGEVNAALEDFDQAARNAAEAALEAARAEQFRQMVDTENLRIRLLVAQGLDDEAFALKQSLELLNAVEAGRSEEYIALLKQVHAQEAANRAAQEQASALTKQADAARDATRAIDGTLRVLGGPAGLTERLAEYRNRALRGGAADFGVSSPDFSGGGAVVNNGDTTFNVTINAAPGQDGGELYEQFKTRFRRDQQLGGVNPFGGV